MFQVVTVIEELKILCIRSTSIFFFFYCTFLILYTYFLNHNLFHLLIKTVKINVY